MRLFQASWEGSYEMQGDIGSLSRGYSNVRVQGMVFHPKILRNQMQKNMDVNGVMRGYECVPFGFGSCVEEVQSEWFLLYQDLGNNPRAAFV